MYRRVCPLAPHVTPNMPRYWYPSLLRLRILYYNLFYEYSSSGSSSSTVDGTIAEAASAESGKKRDE